MALVGWSWWGPGPLKQNTNVVIPEGARLASATDYLWYAGAISGPRWKFYYLARLLGEGDPIQAGEFEIPAHASPDKVLDILQHGKPVARMVTIPEGLPSILVREKVEAIPQLTGDARLPAEGSVLPNSYAWQQGESRDQVIERMLISPKSAATRSKPNRPISPQLRPPTISSSRVSLLMTGIVNS